MQKSYTGNGCCSSPSLCGFSSVRGSSASPHGWLCRLDGSAMSMLLGDGSGVHIGVSTGSFSGFERKTVFYCLFSYKRRQQLYIYQPYRRLNKWEMSKYCDTW